jgi:hypothetical protein
METNAFVKLTSIDSNTPEPGASQGARRATEEGVTGMVDNYLVKVQARALKGGNV